ncbi:MAG: hypothetical protein K2H89_09900 [Oscillospiraceae bacterium]|nr:hypothetical protein [Oscillospiraceae bacterium]
MKIVLIDRDRSDCIFYAIVELDKPFKHPKGYRKYVGLSGKEKLPKLNVIPFSNTLDRWLGLGYEPVNIEEKDFPEVLIKKIKELYTLEES